MQNGNPIGKLFSFLQILRGQEYRRAVGSKFFDGLPDLEACLGVKPVGRLVKKNELRFPTRLMAMSSLRLIPPE